MRDGAEKFRSGGGFAEYRAEGMQSAGARQYQRQRAEEGCDQEQVLMLRPVQRGSKLPAQPIDRGEDVEEQIADTRRNRREERDQFRNTEHVEVPCEAACPVLVMAKVADLRQPKRAAAVAPSQLPGTGLPTCLGPANITQMKMFACLFAAGYL